MINEHGYPALALFVFSPRLSFFALDVYLTRRTGGISLLKSAVFAVKSLLPTHFLSPTCNL